MAVAVFDLDNTLLGGDSDSMWGEYLVEIGAVDAVEYKKRNEMFYMQYQNGTLNINEFLAFALQPLANNDRDTLFAWRDDFLATRIEPIILSKAEALLQQHRTQQNILLIITATNEFITAPIAKRLGVETLIGTKLEEKDGKYTGNIEGIPTFQEGKITAFHQWRKENQLENEPFYFYSDSHNDLPLLKLADHPVAVDPDDQLKAHAESAGWEIISLRD